jgi:hypothetical protein
LDLNRLTKGERIVLIAAVALVILSFIPLWASYSFESEGVVGIDTDQSFSAWSGAYNILVKLGVILPIVAVAMVAARARGTAFELPPITYLALGGAATVLLLIGVLTGPNDGGISGIAADLAGFDVSRGILLYVGVVLAAAMAFGGFMHMQETGTSTTYGSQATPPPPPAR